MSDYMETFDMSQFVDKYVERVRRRIDAEVLERVESELAEYGYVKVVRCRDCRHFITGGASEISFCARVDYEMNPDDFCSYGKRKEGGE